MTRIRRALWASLMCISVWAVPMTGHARPDDAPGGPEGKGACVRNCSQLNKGCVQTAHRLKTSCRARCTEERLDFLEACDPDGDGAIDFDPVIDPDTGDVIDPCTTAQETLNTCLTPCKRTFKGASSRCVLRLRQCFYEQCGIVPPPPNIDPVEEN